MSVIGLPAYLDGGKATRGASPGLQYGFYLNLWEWDRESVKTAKGRSRSVEESLHLSADMRELQKAVFERQNHFAEHLASVDSLLISDGLSVSPFTTGLGIEHPLENGFAFSMPYGLPYFPGSGVKGVLRHAAVELASGAWGGANVWSHEIIDILFGKAYSSDHALTGNSQRGVLTFWDVYPRLSANANLVMEIMTPHQAHYLQAGGADETTSTPHDSGQPVPIPFVSVPPNTEFSFFVQCDLARLSVLSVSKPRDTADADICNVAAELLGGTWKVLLQEAFVHAFTWVGFGAKTSIGYGSLVEDKVKFKEREDQQANLEKEREEELARQNFEKAEKRRIEALDDIDRRVEEEILKLDSKPGASGDYLIRMKALENVDWSDAPEKKIEAAKRLKLFMQNKKVWKETTQKKNPDKDKEHKRTLEVIAWIDGK